MLTSRHYIYTIASIDTSLSFYLDADKVSPCFIHVISFKEASGKFPFHFREIYEIRAVAGQCSLPELRIANKTKMHLKQKKKKKKKKKRTQNR